MKKTLLFMLVLLLIASVAIDAAQKKPNIVIIWGDDIGQSNLSIYKEQMNISINYLRF